MTAPIVETPAGDTRARDAVDAYLALFERHIASEHARPAAATRLLRRWLPELSAMSSAELDPDALDAVAELIREAARVTGPALSLQWLATYPASLQALRAVRVDAFPDVLISWSSLPASFVEDEGEDLVFETLWPALETWASSNEPEPTVSRTDEDAVEFALAA